MDERTAALRRALVDAIAGAHRLRQERLAAEREAARWVQRAAYAEERGMAELAEGARARVARHTRMARLLEQRATEMRAEVQRLRAELDTSAAGGRPPPLDPIEERFAALEIERELERLRATRAGSPPESPSPPTDVEHVV